ncbi:MAG: ribonuclease HII [Ruminococcus sp.]|jgi:ribonuclease HII|nr:ribonuclease HII [Ruminococcus sp.]
MNKLFNFDEEFRHSKEIALLCGIDEAGRGPLAGDVYAAAVVLPPDFLSDGLNDSKKLSEKKRNYLFDEITHNALSYSIAIATIEEIEQINILNAALLAMKRAYSALTVKPEFTLIDGNKLPDIDCEKSALIKGDGTSASVAAASILAKVTRDRYMSSLHEKYPEYCFDKHKGYGTKLHYEKIREYGISPVHRPSFLKKMH